MSALVYIVALLASAADAESTAQTLARAQALYADIELDKVLPLVTFVLARKDATLEQQLDAYVLQGSCLAILGDIVEAEASFRLLLRGRPDFDLPEDTPPKILAVFRKVQGEERIIGERMREIDRQHMIKSLQLTGSAPADHAGGLPLEFKYDLKDPRGVVRAMKVNFRRATEKNFSSLALKRDDRGIWSATLPGELTASERGFLLEYFVETQDAEGRALISHGAPEDLWSVGIQPGEVGDDRPIYESFWFWAATAAAVGAVSALSVVLFNEANKLPDSDLGVVPWHR